jgi:hypothetical protein
LNQESAAAPSRVQVLIPPRPNLGPEPWSEPRAGRFPYEAAALATGALLLAAAWIIRRRLAARRRPGTAPARVDFAADDPAMQLIVMASQARETLAERFGPALLARTTEEIAADPQLRETLGEPRFDSLVRLLATADRRKFATMPGAGAEDVYPEDLSQWETWLSSLPEARASKAR